MKKADQSKLIGKMRNNADIGPTDGKWMGRAGEIGGTKRLAGNETERPAELIPVK